MKKNNNVVESNLFAKKNSVVIDPTKNNGVKIPDGYHATVQDGVILAVSKHGNLNDVVEPTSIQKAETAVKKAVKKAVKRVRKVATKKTAVKKVAVKKPIAKKVVAKKPTTKKTAKKIVKVAKKVVEKKSIFPSEIKYNDATFSKIDNMTYDNFRKESEKGRRLYIAVSLYGINDYKKEVDSRSEMNVLKFPYNIDILTPAFFGDIIKRIMCVSVYSEAMWEFTPADFKIYKQQDSEFAIYEEK